MKLHQGSGISHPRQWLGTVPAGSRDTHTQLGAWANGGDTAAAAGHFGGVPGIPRLRHPCAPATGLARMACAPRNLSPVVGRRGGGQMGALVLGCRWDWTLEIPCTTDPMHAPSQPPAKRTRGALGGSTSTLGDPQDRASTLADPGQAGAAGSLPASLHASPCSAHGIPWPPTPPSRVMGLCEPPQQQPAGTDGGHGHAVLGRAAGSRCRTTAARPGSRAAWRCRAPASAPATPTTTTASASAPRCSQEVSEPGGDAHTAPTGAHPGFHPPTLLPPRRLVVRRLRPLQPERHLLPGPAQHPQAQRHPLAPLPRAQLLPEGHPHADTTRQLLARRRPATAPQPVPAWHGGRGPGGGREKGWLGETEPS